MDKKKFKFKFENVWCSGFIPFAIIWGDTGVGICFLSFAFGVTWEKPY